MKRCTNCRVLNPPAAARCRSCLGLNFEEIKPGIDLSQPPEDMNPIHKIIHPDPHTNLPHDSDEMSNRATLLAELLGDTVFTPNPLTDSQIADLQKKSKSDNKDLYWAIVVFCLFGSMAYLNSAFGRLVDPRILMIILTSLLLLAGLLISPNRTGSILLQTLKIVLLLLMLQAIIVGAMFIALLLICSQML